MKGARKLAEMLRTEAGRCTEVHALVIGRAGALEIAAHLDRLAAIDSAEPGEVGEIQQRADEAHLWDGCPPRRCEEAEKDRADLLAIVHSQAGVIADLRRRPAESRALRAEIERDAARSEVTQLTERLRMMQHGEAEALRMMEAEKQRADKLADEVNRYAQRELAYTHIDPPAEKLPAPLACPNCDRRDSWCEFLGDSGLMRCEKPSGGCGYSMSLDANEPENLRQARDLLRQEKAEAGATILRLRGEATEQRERAVASELNAREQKGLADLAMQVVATRSRELMVAEERARVLANGIAAYRTGGYTAAQVWENGEGKAVPR